MVHIFFGSSHGGPPSVSSPENAHPEQGENFNHAELNDLVKDLGLS